jgi:hypothetical protein
MVKIDAFIWKFIYLFEKMYFLLDLYTHVHKIVIFSLDFT